MRVRATKDLARLGDSDFYAEVAVGLDLVVTNARRLDACASTLVGARNFHGAHVLQLLSEEEASKYLILIDAVRCPRQSDKFVAQLGRFNDHLAKGLYAQAYWFRSSTLVELQGYLDQCREEFYLDGPNDVDWIFRNQIIHHREEALYVDYVDTDDGHRWWHPGIYADSSFNIALHFESIALQTAIKLHDIGVSTPDALSAIAKIWRQVEMKSEIVWSEVQRLNHHTLECLGRKGLLKECSSRSYYHIIDRWQFPLYSLDLSLLRIDKDSLREKQRSWSPYAFD